ncbi:MAG: T9SS type A sorting domain-containing protein [Sphingobacteriales bacterium]
MRRIYTNYCSWKIGIAIAVFMNFAFAYGGPVIKDTIYLHSKKAKNKQSILKNGLPFSLPPVKPGVTSYVKFTVNHQDDKLLSDVEVYPNPATDQINLKYVVSRNTNVSIKIMDVLGNDLLNVFQQRVDLGEQKFSYSISNKLSRGFYFVKIVAGTESVIKRISIL